jgi:hypothetical protein
VQRRRRVGIQKPEIRCQSTEIQVLLLPLEEGSVAAQGRQPETRNPLPINENPEESIDRIGTAGRGWTVRAREEEKMGIGPGIGIGRFWFF